MKSEIYRIQLIADLGFIYANVIKINDLPNCSESGSIVYIYNKLTSKPEEPEYIDLINSGYLYSPMLLHSRPKQRGKGKWHRISSITVNKQESMIPLFKDEDNRFYSNDRINPSDEFYVIKDCNPNNWVLMKYSEIHDMGLWMHYNSDFMLKKMSIKVAVDKQLDLDKVFEKEFLSSFSFKKAKVQILKSI